MPRYHNCVGKFKRRHQRSYYKEVRSHRPPQEAKQMELLPREDSDAIADPTCPPIICLFCPLQNRDNLAFLEP